jgi:hypothetical protein
LTCQECSRSILSGIYPVCTVAAHHPTPLPVEVRGDGTWTPEDERIKNEGLVLILKELHDKLDALVFEAYGWPATLTDEEILQQLVALNKERALEETSGREPRWLRPDHQIPRFGSDAERARLDEERRRARQADMARAGQGALTLEDDLQEMKPRFPTGHELAETAAVMRALAGATEALTIEQIARSFSQGRQVEKRVGLTILALARLGTCR